MMSYAESRWPRKVSAILFRIFAYSFYYILLSMAKDKDKDKDTVETDPPVSKSNETVPVTERPSRSQVPAPAPSLTGVPKAASSVNIHLTLSKKFRCIRIFSVLLFLTLWAISFGAIVGYGFLWTQWEYVDDITNAYSAFFGFITALVFNVVGCTAALATFQIAVDTHLPLDAVHSTAVCMLLFAGILFNIAFPTAGLLPLEIGRMRRLHSTAVMTCVTNSKQNGQAPECQDADNIKLCLFVTYSLIPLEIIALATFMYLKHVQEQDIKRSKGVTPEETLTALALREGYNIHREASVMNVRAAASANVKLGEMLPESSKASIVPNQKPEKDATATLGPGPSVQQVKPGK